MNDDPMNDDSHDEPPSDRTDRGRDDGQIDDRIVLISSYLDDHVTDVERARVEADRRAMGEVARLRRTQEAVARIDPPDATVRERALAAALATADEAGVVGGSGRAAGSDSDVVPLFRRRPARRLLAVAAGCAALAALGGVAVTVIDDGNDDSSSTSGAAIERSPEAPRDDVGDAEDGLSSAGAATEATDGAPAEADAAHEEADTEELGGPGGAPAPPADGTFADDGTSDGDAGADVAVGTTHVGEIDDATLAEEVRALLDGPAEDGTAEDGTAEDGTGNGCSDVIDPVLGTGDFQGRVVLVGTDPDGRLARAVDADDCAVVAEAPLSSGG